MTKIFVVQQVTLFGYKNMTRGEYNDLVNTNVSLHITEHGAFIKAYNNTIDIMCGDADNYGFEKIELCESKDVSLDEIKSKYTELTEIITSSYDRGECKYYEIYYKVYEVKLSC